MKNWNDTWVTGGKNDVSPDDLDAIFHGAFDEKPDNPNISERVVNESSYLAR